MINVISKKCVNVQSNEYSVKVGKALGDVRLQETTARQRGIMDEAFLELLEEEEGDLEKISDQEIIGIYEMVTEIVSPIEIELIQGGT
jgi:hypothetical protein